MAITCDIRSVMMLAVTLTLTPLTWAQATFERLGFLGSDATTSQASSVSADGSVVVGQCASASGVTELFRWTAEGGMVRLTAGGGELGRAGVWGVSTNGVVISGYRETNDGWQGFRWTVQNGFEDLGDLPGGVHRNHPGGMSADGTVIVGLSSGASGFEAYRWEAGQGLRGLGSLGDGSSAAGGVAADGSVVAGFCQVGSYQQATYWTPTTGWVSLGHPPDALWSNAWAVSADGALTTGVFGGHQVHGKPAMEAVRWRIGGGLVRLGFLSEATPSSTPFSISGDGGTIVGMSRVGQESVAFIWTQGHGMRNLQHVLEQEHGLNLEGWRLHIATGITPDGTVIVGNGTSPDGHQEAWLVRLKGQQTER